MQPIQSKPSSAAPTALVYITIGSLLTVWSGVWFLYENNTEGSHRGIFYICGGLLLTGIAMLAIGFSIGKLHKKAQEGEFAAQANAAQAAAAQQDPALARKL